MSETAWYGLKVNGELVRVKRFDNGKVPDLNNVDDFKLWEIPFLPTSTYEIVATSFVILDSVQLVEASI